MSLTKKKPMRAQGFSLRKSRKVREQPSRNFNLERIVNNNDDDEMIIIPKNKVAELQDKFTYINSLVDLRDLLNTDIFNSNDNLIITKSQFPREHQYSYFKGPKGTNVHLNTAEAISADKLWSLLPDALYRGHVPTRYLRILQDFLGDIDRVSLSDHNAQVPRPRQYRPDESRAQRKKTRKVYKNNVNNQNKKQKNTKNSKNNNAFKAEKLFTNQEQIDRVIKAAQNAQKRLQTRKNQRNKMTKNMYAKKNPSVRRN